MTKPLKDEQKVTLWTRQDIRSLDDLEKNGVYRVKREYIENQYGDIAEHFIIFLQEDSHFCKWVMNCSYKTH